LEPAPASAGAIVYIIYLSPLAHLPQPGDPFEAAPQTSHLFIVNPLSGEALMKLFSTHPPLDERIVRLRQMRERR
jgi:Zn-dependent protease with chaperone function